MDFSSFQIVWVKLWCYVLKVLSGGSIVIPEEERLRVGIHIIVSDFLFMVYFVYKSYGGYSGSISSWETSKYHRN